MTTRRHFIVRMVVTEVITPDFDHKAREQVVCHAEREFSYGQVALQQIMNLEQECTLKLGSLAHDMKEALGVRMGAYLEETK